MAARSWITSICTAIGVAAGAGAAQLGVGYGLNVITWAPATDERTARTLWLASLAWVAWLAANSTVLGALCADRLTARGDGDGGARPLPGNGGTGALPAGSTAGDLPDGSTTGVVDTGDAAGVSDGARSGGGAPDLITVAWRVVIALAAAIGALITVPLVAVPASFAPQANNSAPQFTVGGYAIAGIVVGVIVAVGALHARAVATNVMASATWLWLLAVAAVVHGLQIDAEPGVAQLATWQFTGGRVLRQMVNLPSALLMVGVAFLLGLLAAWAAGRRGDGRVGVAISGATGPLLVAAAYFLALPGVNGSEQQLSAAVMAPYAVLAGLAGSVIISAVGSRASRERSRVRREARDDGTYEEWRQAMAAVEGGSGGTSTSTSPATGEGTDAAGPTYRLPGTPSGKATGRARAGGKPSPGPTRSSSSDLADDAYAPARAYVSDTAEEPPAKSGRTRPGKSTGKGTSPAPSTGSGTTGTGSGDDRPSGETPEPIWPEETRPSPSPRSGRWRKQR